LLQIFKRIEMIHCSSGDGVPFDFDTLMGNFSSFSNCSAFSMAVYQIHLAAITVFFVIFCVVNRA
jgi:hypothetical protein